MKKSLIGMVLFVFTMGFASCSDNNDDENTLNLTPKVGFIQDGKELLYPVSIRFFKGNEDFFKEYSYDTQYHYFVNKKDNAIFPPSYTSRPYPPMVEDIKNELISIDKNNIYTISYRMVKENTNFYFVEYDVEVNDKDFVLERTFVIDDQGIVTKK